MKFNFPGGGKKVKLEINITKRNISVATGLTDWSTTKFSIWAGLISLFYRLLWDHLNSRAELGSSSAANTLSFFYGGIATKKLCVKTSLLSPNLSEDPHLSVPLGIRIMKKRCIKNICISTIKTHEITKLIMIKMTDEGEKMSKCVAFKF